MSMFSGITIALREDNGFELNMADVRMEFSESFQVLNSTAVEFDQWCSALDRLEQLNRSIEHHDGRADKALITFLNQNNDLAEALGVDLSFENWDEEAKGAEIRQGYSMAMEGVWEAIKNFFINIWEGIKNFFSNFGKMFKSSEAKLDSVINNPKVPKAEEQAKYVFKNGSQANISVNPQEQNQQAQQPATPAQPNQSVSAPNSAMNSKATITIQSFDVKTNAEKAVVGNDKVPGDKKVVIKAAGIETLLKNCWDFINKCKPLFSATTIEQLAAANVQPLSDADLEKAKTVPPDSLIIGDNLTAMMINQEQGLVDNAKFFRTCLDGAKKQYAEAKKCENTFSSLIADAEKMSKQANVQAAGIDKAKANLKCIVQCITIIGKLIQFIDAIATDYEAVAKKITEAFDAADAQQETRDNLPPG